MRKNNFSEHLEKTVQFCQPLDHPEAPPCLMEVAASLDGQMMPLQDGVDQIKPLFPQIPLEEGQDVNIRTYLEFIEEEWTGEGWLTVLIREDGAWMKGWEVVHFKRPT